MGPLNGKIQHICCSKWQGAATSRHGRAVLRGAGWEHHRGGLGPWWPVTVSWSQGAGDGSTGTAQPSTTSTTRSLAGATTARRDVPAPAPLTSGNAVILERSGLFYLRLRAPRNIKPSVALQSFAITGEHQAFPGSSLQNFCIITRFWVFTPWK